MVRAAISHVPRIRHLCRAATEQPYLVAARRHCGGATIPRHGDRSASASHVRRRDPRPRSGPLTVLYDDGCGVCRETVRRLRRWDREGRFEFMPLRLAASCGRLRLEQLAAEGHLADAVHVVDEATGRVVSGGTRHSPFSMRCRWLAPSSLGRLAADRRSRRRRLSRRLAASRPPDMADRMRDEVSCPIGSTEPSTSED